MAVTALLVSGCETRELASAIPAPVSIIDSTDSDLAELARYGNAVRELNNRQLDQQYRDLVLQNDAILSTDAAIKLSLLLSSPNASFHDVDQALRFLRDVVQRESEPEQAEFAKLLYNLLSERMYAASDDESLAAMLTQARDRNEELNDELAQAREELAAERERRETLQGQLNALKALEEQLSLEDIE